MPRSNDILGPINFLLNEKFKKFKRQVSTLYINATFGQGYRQRILIHRHFASFCSMSVVQRLKIKPFCYIRQTQRRSERKCNVFIAVPDPLPLSPVLHFVALCLYILYSYSSTDIQARLRCRQRVDAKQQQQKGTIGLCKKSCKDTTNGKNTLRRSRKITVPLALFIYPSKYI